MSPIKKRKEEKVKAAEKETVDISINRSNERVQYIHCRTQMMAEN